VPTITPRDPATGRFISAEAFARLSTLTLPEVNGRPKEKPAKKKTGKKKVETVEIKASAKNGKKKTAKAKKGKKGKKKR
jgi:hypothetical protein